MSVQNYSNDTLQCRMPEARYAYYRRCQMFRRSGEQCKAPAEKGEHTCYAHARQQAMEARRTQERQTVLDEAARRIRLHPTPGERGQGLGTHDFCAADVFMDFDAIQMTLGVVARAIIDGRIDSKTAGRLLWELQIAAKLLRLQQRAAMVATRRNSRGLEGADLQNVGEPTRAAEQILQPHAKNLEDRRYNARSPSGWHLQEEAVAPKQAVIDIGRAALASSHFEEIFRTCYAERRASPGEAGTPQVEVSREIVLCHTVSGSSLAVAVANDAVSVELPVAA